MAKWPIYPTARSRRLPRAAPASPSSVAGRTGATKSAGPTRRESGWRGKVSRAPTETSADMQAASDTEVIIVGAGPVGLTLAIDLGKRGIRCTLIERKDAPAFLPKMERCNARTMEMYRRIGLAEPIRAAGLRADVPMDVFIILSMTEPPLLHTPYPSVDAARRAIASSSDGSMPLEPYQLISQYTLEPLLKPVAEGRPTVTLRFGCEFESFVQDAAGVTVTARTSDGQPEPFRAAYLVGCDGGASPV